MSKATTTIEDKQYLIEAVLPEATSSYTVIPHELIINTVSKLIEEKGFSIVKEIYKYNTAAQVACGIYYLSHQTDEDMGMMFTWTNSYDKTVRFKCFVGAYIKLNGNILISNSDGSTFKRKHTGEADHEVQETVSEQLTNAISYYSELIEDKNLMKTFEITDETFAEKIGRLYITDRLLSSEQINIIKREYMKPSYTYNCGKNCLWTFYNYILTGVIKCHPSKWAEQQRLIHMWMKTEFEINSQSLPITEVSEEKSITREIVTPLEAPVIETPTISEEEEEEKQEEEIEGFASMIYELRRGIPVLVLKKWIFDIMPQAEMNTILTFDDCSCIITDENDTHFVLELFTPIDESEAIIEEPVSVIEESPIVLPKSPQKLKAEAPSIQAKDIQILPPEKEVNTFVDDEIRNKISQKIFELYGGIRQFTYEKTPRQYNVLLESGESCCLNNI